MEFNPTFYCGTLSGPFVDDIHIVGKIVTRTRTAPDKVAGEYEEFVFLSRHDSLQRAEQEMHALIAQDAER